MLYELGASFWSESIRKGGETKREGKMRDENERRKGGRTCEDEDKEKDSVPSLVVSCMIAFA